MFPYAKGLVFCLACLHAFALILLQLEILQVLTKSTTFLRCSLYTVNCLTRSQKSKYWPNNQKHRMGFSLPSFTVRAFLECADYNFQICLKNYFRFDNYVWCISRERTLHLLLKSFLILNEMGNPIYVCATDMAVKKRLNATFK